NYSTTLSQPLNPDSLSASLFMISCNGGNNGRIQLTVNGGVAPYTYAWSNGSSLEDQLNLPAGIYTVVVTDGNGCQDSATYTLTEPSLLVASSLPTPASCAGGL